MTSDTVLLGTGLAESQYAVSIETRGSSVKTCGSFAHVSKNLSNDSRLRRSQAQGLNLLLLFCDMHILSNYFLNLYLSSYKLVHLSDLIPKVSLCTGLW